MLRIMRIELWDTNHRTLTRLLGSSSWGLRAVTRCCMGRKMIRLISPLLQCSLTLPSFTSNHRSHMCRGKGTPSYSEVFSGWEQNIWKIAPKLHAGSPRLLSAATLIIGLNYSRQRDTVKYCPIKPLHKPPMYYSCVYCSFNLQCKWAL